MIDTIVDTPALKTTPDIVEATQTPSRRRGRPRSFDCDLVLDKAIDVFSERGFNGTSITDLTTATGLSQGSLYKAFGDKRGLFLAALKRWRVLRKSEQDTAMEGARNGRERVERFLDHFANGSQGEAGLRGCPVVSAATDVATFDEEVASFLCEGYRQQEELIADLVRQGQQDGSITRDLDPADTARTMQCLIQGMRVIGKTGRTHEEVAPLPRLALKILT